MNDQKSELTADDRFCMCSYFFSLFFILFFYDEIKFLCLLVDVGFLLLFARFASVLSKCKCLNFLLPSLVFL